MTGTIILDPLLPVWIILIAAALSAIGISTAVWRRLSGWWLRAGAGIVLLAAVLNPSWQQEERDALSDIVIAVVDQSSSQKIAGREAQTNDALSGLASAITALGNTELRVVELSDGDGDTGTLAMTALAQSLAREPQGRIAGAFVLSDGRIHDMERLPVLPAPLHFIQSGKQEDWDRRLVVRNAPAFAVLGEQVTLKLRIEDQGAAPGDALAPLSISIDGEPPFNFEIPVNQDMDLPLTLPHGGLNVLQFETPAVAGELTDRNNVAIVQMNGVRDRLRVLLVSGEPHPGERTWRNLLKSDAGVDLVHFTILRPPEKQDGVPVNELSLIAFPTRELFLEKIDEFDLIIFDRYRRRGILPNAYLDNVRAYVEGGGAVLVSAGPEYGSADSIYRSSLGAILPGAPTARVVERGFTPLLTELGRKHPVTEGLDAFAPAAADGAPGWGRWFRLIDVFPSREADIVMQGEGDRPLLLLNRVGEGRVALLASDHSWLWDRGFEGGGPQLELLRRLAHWMMKEPELEEEALWVEPSGLTMRIVRRTLKDSIGDVTITLPDGSETQRPLEQITPGRFETLWEAPEMGFYRLREGDQTSVIALGPAAPKEFEETIASPEIVAPALAATGGATWRMEDGDVSLRSVRPGRPASGRGWLGITPRGAYQTTSLSVRPILPPALFLTLAAMMLLGAWLREGRRSSTQ